VKRPGYREAIEWLAGNDDCHYLITSEHHEIIMSVAASMVRDLYDVTDEKLQADVRRMLKRIHPNHEALR
jgi:hypothetical protein